MLSSLVKRHKLHSWHVLGPVATDRKHQVEMTKDEQGRRKQLAFGTATCTSE